MIVSFTHDCGCVFSRTLPDAGFYQSHSCVKHVVGAAARAEIEPYITQKATAPPADIRSLFEAAQAVENRAHGSTLNKKG